MSPIGGFPRILLDTNLWRSLADANAVQRLVSASGRRGLAMVITPSLVYENLWLEDVTATLAVIAAGSCFAWLIVCPLGERPHASLRPCGASTFRQRRCRADGRKRTGTALPSGHVLRVYARPGLRQPRLIRLSSMTATLLRAVG
jgi:hypothetical protein